MTTPTLDSSPWEARQRPGSQARRLAADAAAAAELRAYRTDPDVVALRVEHIRTQVDWLMWVGIVLGLCFTMTNVQTFAAAGAPVGSLAWCSAWLLDPMVSLVLLAVLRAEQVTTRYQVSTGPWPRVAKWALLSATYVMNTWVSWAAGSGSGVVLHSVAPLVVVLAAEAITDLQYALSECVQRAHTTAADRAEQTAGDLPDPLTVNTATPVPYAISGGVGEHPAGVGERFTSAASKRVPMRPVNPTSAVAGRSARPVAGGSAGRVGEPRRTPGTSSARPVRRKLLADYLGEARAAWTPGVVVSPAWVRQVTGCSRGLSPKVAAALTAEHHSTARTETEGRAA